MKRITLFFLFIMASACGQRSSNKTGWYKKGLNGPVEEVSIKTYDAVVKDGSVQPKNSSYIFFDNITFDSVGNLLESFSEKKIWLYTTIYKKGSNDVLYERNPKIGSSGGIDTIIYTKGKPDSIISKTQDGTVYYTTKLKLDNEGNIIERVKRSSDGKIVEIIQSKYSYGQFTEEVIMDSSYKELQKTEREIDKDGKVQSLRFYKDGKEMVNTTNKYSDFDTNNNWQTRITYNAENSPVTITKRWFKYYGDRK